MKRMTRRLLGIVASSAVALPMAAQVQADEMSVEPHSHPATYQHAHEMEDGSMSPPHAHEHESHPHSELYGHSATSATLYGSVRSGIIVHDKENDDAQWDLGSVDAADVSGSDALFSRIGVDASHELGGGLTAGLKIEKRLDDFRTRHQNVWLSSDFGKLTLGQQGSPYHAALSWDPSNFTGNQFALSGGSRKSGISYASNLGGPFNFTAMILDDNSNMKDSTKMYTEGEDGIDADDTIGDDEFNSKPTAHKGKAPTGYGTDGIDRFELSGNLALGFININAGYANHNTGVAANDHTVMGATVGGSLSGIGWKIGFETKDPEDSKVEDTDHAGFYVDYDLGPGAPYFYIEDSSGGVKDGTHSKGDGRAWVVGYSHGLGSGIKVIGEHLNKEDYKGQTATTSILAIRVDF